ncbi:ribosome biogenesis protein Nop16 [Xylaria sp. FL1777]|nr:ribosome biogenesis protein Nop16 [Xylaria sp. FL1777]
MGRELQKRKRRSSRPAIRQPSSTRSKLTNPLGNNIIARNWNKKETTLQNYRRLGLLSRLGAHAGGLDRKLNTTSTDTDTTSSSNPPASKNPFAIKGAKGTEAVAGEVQVERDESGKIVRVISTERKRPNPLNDPLAELDTDSEAEPVDEGGEDADEWDGFEQNEIVRQLEDEANRPVEKKPRTASAREAEWLQRLVDRHGDDTVAMARDGKLNPMQQTAADIARRIRKWRGNSR